MWMPIKWLSLKTDLQKLPKKIQAKSNALEITPDEKSGNVIKVYSSTVRVDQCSTNKPRLDLEESGDVYELNEF